MRIWNGKKGIALMELVAALALFAIVAVPLGRLFVDSFRYQNRSQMNTEANKVADFFAEKIKNGDYTLLTESGITGKEGTGITTTEYFSSDGNFPSSLKYIVAVDVKRASASINPQEVESGTPQTFSRTVTINSGGTATLTGSNITISKKDSANFALTLVSAVADENILVTNNSGVATNWNIIVDNQSINRVNFYVKKAGISTGDVFMLGAVNTVGNFTRFDLGKENKLTGKLYETYDVTIYTRVKKEQESIGNYNTFIGEEGLFKLTTSIKREVSV